MINLLESIGVFILTFLGLLFSQKRLRFEIQGILLLLTKNRELTRTIFALIFIPGVFLHEISHFVTAKLLRVKTRRFSIVPRPLPSGNIRLGYVEIEATDFFRESIIGLAPFFTGLVALTFLIIYQLHIEVTSLDGLWKQISMGSQIKEFYNQPDFWVWLYLCLTISNMMFPSESDRKAWFPVILIGVIFILVGFILGIGEWFWGIFNAEINQFLAGMATIIGFALLINILPLVILWPCRLILSKMTHSSIVGLN